MTDPYNCEINLLTALDWQRSAADVAQKFIRNEQDWLEKNHCKFWEDWQKNVFTLDTANDFGLSVWSIILDEPIYGESKKSPDDYPDWGFSTTAENFFDGSFAVDSDYSYEFTTEENRIMLKLKAFKVLAMGGPVRQTNTAMKNIFGENVIVAFDKLDMSYIYQLNDKTIINFIREIQKRDLLPRPIGIEIDSIIVFNPGTWGFAEGDENFFDGNFYDGTI